MLYHEAADRVVIEVCRAVVLWPQALQACEHRARECAQTERRRRDDVRDMDWSTRQYRMQVAVYLSSVTRCSCADLTGEFAVRRRNCARRGWQPRSAGATLTVRCGTSD